MAQQPVVKPITLTILPIHNQQPIPNTIYQTPGPISSTNITYQIPGHVSSTKTPYQGQIPIPNFNHVPIIPTIVAPEPTHRGAMKQLTAEEREARRAAQQRERNAKYQEKIREYKKIGVLKSEKEKIIRVLQLCYPFLEEMDSFELDTKVNAFIQTLHPPQNT
ncbi:Hypothetical protein HVR_LOCUS584 [uncultured virus]|nr:Hypothetical protein HVR_LOCUS584 [uncultured virus]